MQDITVKVTAEGERFQRLLDELTRTTLSVGFKPGEHFEEDGTDVAEVALRNELGDDRIPARPFMRQTVENHEAEITALVHKAASRETAKDILNLIGDGISQLMRDEISNGDFAPNAPATIVAKGSDKPLIDTGTMRDSVEFWLTKE